MSRPIVALSIGDSPDVARLGYSELHLDDIAIRLARMLLGLDLDIAYGGVFRSKSFTDTLLNVVGGQEQERDDVAVAQHREAHWRARLVNYQPWPFHFGISPDVVANNLGLCRFVRVDPPDHEGLAQPPAGFSSPNNAWLGALALTRMREAMMTGATDIDRTSVDGASARIVLGGRTEGWAGALPGIAEETEMTLAADKPVFVLGGFGGCAHHVARALTGDFPTELTMDYHAKRGGPFANTMAGFSTNQPGALQARFDDLRIRLEAARHGLKLNNALSPEENRQLFVSEDIVTICRLIEKGLRASVLGPSKGS